MGNLWQDQDAYVGNRIGPNSTTYIGITEGHWETISGSFSIPFGSGSEVPSMRPIFPSSRRTIYEEDKFYSSLMFVVL